MIDLFYITNNIVEAQIVDNLDIDWIFIDLETIGKKERQIGRDTVLSNHSISDVQDIKTKISNSKILVRCNPIGEWSRAEIDQINQRYSDIDMVILPYFKTPEEVKIFIDLLDTSRIEPALLIETLGSVTNLQEIINLYPFEYFHIGLNDLHIERGTVSMFEPFVDGLLENISSILKKNNQNFGIGGIGKIGSKMSPTPECILNEHIRLNSSGVIISRSFKGDFVEKKREKFERELSESIKALRSYEKIARKMDNRQLLKSYKLMETDILKDAK